MAHSVGKKKGWRFYACYKNSHNGGTILSARDTCEEAWNDLKRLSCYVQNDLIFIGVVKCKDEDPLSHIKNIN